MIALWTIEDALALISPLQERVAEFGYHITLGGHILKGEKIKQLELFCIPREAGEANVNGLRKLFEGLWNKPEEGYVEMPSLTYSTGTSDNMLRTPAARRNTTRRPEPVIAADESGPLTTNDYNITFSELMKIAEESKSKQNYRFVKTYIREGDSIRVYAI